MQYDTIIIIPSINRFTGHLLYVPGTNLAREVHSAVAVSEL